MLVASRGEIVMRIFRACRVMNIATVAVYTRVDRGASHVCYTEEAYYTSNSPEDTSYLKPEKILQIAKKMGAAIHPGYDFLSESADFARRYEEEGVIFIDPSASIIAQMGIKAEARRTMHETDLPIVPGTEDPVKGIAETKKVAAEVDYPIILKALAGDDGKGMRLVCSGEEVGAAFRLSQSEAGTSFGNDAVYIEKCIKNPHHIEVQILGDKYGDVIHPYERECSVQRHNQEVIEESPSLFVGPETRAKMLRVTVEACKRTSYYNAGTLEFTVDKNRNLYFLEMNTHLQVEHSATGECTGVSLVRDMILVIAGNRLPYRQEDVEFQDVATGCHIYVEGPENNFMSSPEVITIREAPEERDVRLNSTTYAGFEASLHCNPMITKLCRQGHNRDSAISNMARALREYKTLGIKTTIPFHQRVPKNAAFLKGEYDTTFIDTRFDKENLKRRQDTDPTVAMIAAALKHYKKEEEAASRATTLPVVEDLLWKYYDKLQMAANNY